MYAATIIGAGFASGQEIVQFFSSYYKGGFYGIVVAGALFAVIGYIVLDKVYRERIRNYDEFLFPTVGWIIGWIMEIVVTLFMLSLFCVMISGLGKIISEKFSLPFGLGVVLMSVVCMIVILTDIRGIMAVSLVVTPVLITGIVAVGLYIIASKDTAVFSTAFSVGKITDNWFFSSLLYVSYNSIISVVVMCSLLPYLKTRKIGIMGGVLGGLLLCFIAFILNTAISLFYPNSLAKELPVLSIVEKYSSILGILYTCILVLAMFISAVTSGYCFIDRTSSKTRINKKLLTVLLCILAIPLSNYGFSNIIATVYPIFGYVGLFMVFAVLIQGIRLRPIVNMAQRLGRSVGRR
jgi:uncharacterized membrane protein YkvI